MLPAADLTEIIANLAGLNLQPDTAAAVLGALAPLLRTAQTPPAVLEPPSKPSRRPRSSKRPRGGRRKRKYQRHAPSEARDRALAALKNNPDATTTEIAKVAKVSRSTIVKARVEIAKAERKAARKAKAAPIAVGATRPAKSTERQARAQRFLKDTLASGPRNASDVEAAAAKAHVNPHALEQARADLGVVTSRNTTAGNALSIQWSLPG